MFLRFYSRLAIATVSFMAMVPSNAINLGTDTALPRPDLDSEPSSYQMAQLSADQAFDPLPALLAQTDAEADMIFSRRGKDWFDSARNDALEAKQDYKEKKNAVTVAR